MAKRTHSQTSTVRSSFSGQDGVTETNHGILDYLSNVERLLKDLPEDVRTQLKHNRSAVVRHCNAESSKVNQRTKTTSSKRVVRSVSLTPEQREAWVTALQPVWKKFEKDIGRSYRCSCC
ncbi:hypothetical protein O9929_05275 [Vibrio lentus]|nr:hypothetical protein [Vibrio lentus]